MHLVLLFSSHLNLIFNSFPPFVLMPCTFLISGGIEKLIMMDTSYDMVKLCKDTEQEAQCDHIETSFMVGDEEFLPVKER